MIEEDHLIVFWDGFDTPVGRLLKTVRGRVAFVYSPEWIKKGYQPISINFPCADEIFSEEQSSDFFENLMPEGRSYAAMCEEHDIEQNEIFKFLQIYGHECAGALNIVGKSEKSRDEGIYNDVTDKLEEYLFEHKNSSRSLTAITNSRLSIAGYQDKIQVYFNDGRFYIAAAAAWPKPTNAILKTVSKDFPHLHNNEHFCMSLGRQIGLDVPFTEIYKAGQQEFLFISRYDRLLIGEKLLRIHQEDFCQALGVRKTKKYQDRGGPGILQCFKILKNPIVNDFVETRNKFIQGIIYNYIIGNCDAHLKNFSFLYLPNKKAVLAPLYDLASTRIYPSLTSILAMYIGGTKNFTEVNVNSWKQFCTDIQINTNFFCETAQRIITQVNNESGSLISKHSKKYGNNEDYSRLDRVIEYNSNKLQEAVNEMRDPHGTGQKMRPRFRSDTNSFKP